MKILFNKKDTALIQMAEPQQAIHAINHLDKVKLWGKAIRVMHSKHTNVQVENLCNGFLCSIYWGECTLGSLFFGGDLCLPRRKKIVLP